MERLLKLALKSADEAEVFHCETVNGYLRVRDSDLNDISGGMKTGYALRIIKGGKLGTAYTKNLLDREGLVQGALASLKGNVDAGFSFPKMSKVRGIDLYDKGIESLSFSRLYDLAEGTVGFFGSKVKGQMNLYTGFKTEKRRVANSSGLERVSRESVFYTSTSLVYPKGNTGLFKSFYNPGPRAPPRRALQEQLDEYNASLPIVDVGSGRFQVLLRPDALFPILWRLSEATSGKNIYEKTSPLTGKAGEHVVSDKVTLYNDPHDTKSVGAMAFDDEGVPTRRLDLIKDGVFKTCYVNLGYAARLGMKPTGNGFRSETFMPGDPVTMQPAPLLKNLCIAPGKDKYEDLVQSMDRGIIVDDIMGPHSGNILNGDFSVSMSPGFLVRKGEIAGRVRDGMIAGNVYDLLRKVSGIENKMHDPESMNKNPCMLLDDVSVSAK